MKRNLILPRTLAGVLGLAADYATGANYEQTPNPLDVTLVPKE